MKRKKIIEAYDYQEIINAGEYLATGEGYYEQIDVVYWWRKIHAKPLQRLFCSLWAAPNLFVAQRLKRIDSIRQKLLRNKKLTLWDMQDIGGCRVVVDSPKELKKAVKYDIGKDFTKIRRSNYIKKPKKDGYRGIHRIYRYEPYYEDLPGLDFEVQYRTSYQHAWATAVEVMSSVEGFNIKAGEGPEDIKRFFVVASSILALEEGQPVVPDTKADMTCLLKELAHLNKKESIIARLTSHISPFPTWCREPNVSNRIFSLLCLDEVVGRLDVYDIRDMEKAIAAYDVAETHPDKNVVLTRIEEAAVATAYPNYLRDARTFAIALQMIARENGITL